jgi:hypothetical protein
VFTEAYRAAASWHWADVGLGDAAAAAAAEAGLAAAGVGLAAGEVGLGDALLPVEVALELQAPKRSPAPRAAAKMRHCLGLVTVARIIMVALAREMERLPVPATSSTGSVDIVLPPSLSLDWSATKVRPDGR